MAINPEYAPFAAVALFLVGVVCGAVAARLVLPTRKQLRRLTAELEKLRAEHEAYRGSVTRHFETTSELVASMTESYKAVYDHLAQGARSLCEKTKALAPGEFGAPRLVFDERLDLGANPDPSSREREEAQDEATAAAGENAPDERIPASKEPPTLEMTREPAEESNEEASEERREEEPRPSLH